MAEHITQQVIDAFTANDLDGLAALMAGEVTWHAVDAHGACHDRAQVVDLMRRQVAAGVRGELVESQVMGSCVMVALTVTAPEGVLPDDMPADQPVYKVITTGMGGSITSRTASTGHRPRGLSASSDRLTSPWTEESSRCHRLSRIGIRSRDPQVEASLTCVANQRRGTLAGRRAGWAGRRRGGDEHDSSYTSGAPSSDPPPRSGPNHEAMIRARRGYGSTLVVGVEARSSLGSGRQGAPPGRPVASATPRGAAGGLLASRAISASTAAEPSSARTRRASPAARWR